MATNPTTETLSNPETDQLEQSVGDFVEKIITRYANEPDSSTGRAFASFKRGGGLEKSVTYKDPAAALAGFIQQERGRVKHVETMYATKYLNELFDDIEKTSESSGYEDLAFVHDALDTLAESGIFEGERKEVAQFINLAVNKYVGMVRQFVMADPSAGDMLSAYDEDSRNAFRVYLAVESAITGDFESARGMLIDIDGEDVGKLESALLSRLDEAEAAQDITPLVSHEKSDKYTKEEFHPSEETLVKVESSDPAITVGTSIETLGEMISPGGRYMTVSEFNVRSNGFADGSGTSIGNRNVAYNGVRSFVEQSIGHSDNPFMPRPVYGALTSDLQADRGSGYGRVTLYPSKEILTDPRTVFVEGDSLSMGSGGGDVPLLDFEGAKRAYGTLVEREPLAEESRSMALGRAYIEAQVPGLRLDQLDKVAIVCDRTGRYTTKTYELVDSVVERGILCDVQIDWTGWNLDDGIQRRIDSGMSKEQAFAEMMKAIRSNFQQGDNPLLNIVVYATSEQERAEGHLGRELNLDTILLVANGVTVKRPQFGKLLGRSDR